MGARRPGSHPETPQKRRLLTGGAGDRLASGLRLKETATLFPRTANSLTAPEVTAASICAQVPSGGVTYLAPCGLTSRSWCFTD